MKQNVVKKLPLLKGDDRPFWPLTAECPVCGRRISEGVAYISGGADLMDATGRNGVNTPRLKAFLAIGYHGRDVEVRDSFDAPIVKDLAGGQFDLQFCSFDCLLTAVTRIVDFGKRSLTRKTSRQENGASMKRGRT